MEGMSVREGVAPVEHHDVDVVGLEALEGFVGACHGLGVDALAGVQFRQEVHLGGDEDVASPAVASEELAEGHLAAAAAVHVRRVEEVDAGLVQPGQDGDPLAIGVQAAVDDPRDLKVGAAQASVRHAGLLAAALQGRRGRGLAGTHVPVKTAGHDGRTDSRGGTAKKLAPLHGRCASRAPRFTACKQAVARGEHGHPSGRPCHRSDCSGRDAGESTRRRAASPWSPFGMTMPPRHATRPRGGLPMPPRTKSAS